MRTYISAAFILAISIAEIAPANADYIVDAKNDSIPSPLDTGLILDPADEYQFSVEDPATLWYAGNGPQYASTANGIPYATEVANGDNDNGVPGGWTYDGFYADFGSLIGYTTTNGYFFIGTGSDFSGISGDLSLLYWDAYPIDGDGYGDNSGIQTLDVTDMGPATAVPEPQTWTMLLLGFFGVAAVLRRNKMQRGDRTLHQSERPNSGRSQTK